MTTHSRYPRKITAFLATSGLGIAVLTTSPTALLPNAAAEPVCEGSISWGVKESFRKYIKGPIARGDYQALGTATSNDAGVFTFPISTGDTDKSIDSTGGATFTGHAGKLNTALENIQLTMKDTTTGVLNIKTTSNKADGTPALEPGTIVTFADVTFDTPLKNGEANVGTVTITEAGSNALAGFYGAGTELDNLTVSPQACAQPDPASPPDNQETPNPIPVPEKNDEVKPNQEQETKPEGEASPEGEKTPEGDKAEENKGPASSVPEGKPEDKPTGKPQEGKPVGDTAQKSEEKKDSDKCGCGEAKHEPKKDKPAEAAKPAEDKKKGEKKLAAVEKTPEQKSAGKKTFDKAENSSPEKKSSEKKGSRGSTERLASTGGDAADATDFSEYEVKNQAEEASSESSSPVMFASLAAVLVAVAAGCTFLACRTVRK